MGYFDNSGKNKYNPDPTYDGMMIGMVEYTVDAKSDYHGRRPLSSK